jgi:hypothetical protein
LSGSLKEQSQKAEEEELAWLSKKLGSLKKLNRRDLPSSLKR